MSSLPVVVNPNDGQHPHSFPPQRDEDGALDLMKILATFRRRLRLFSIVALVVFSAIAVSAFLQTPRYVATARIVIEAGRSQVTDVKAVVSDPVLDNSRVDTQVQLLKSPRLVETVVRDLKLDENPEFNASLDAGGPLKKLGLGASKPQSAEQQFNKTVEAVRQKLVVKREGQTLIIAVSFKSKDPAVAAQVANAVVGAFMEEQVRRKVDANSQANSWLAKRVEELRGQVQTAEAEVERYKIANNLMSASGATLTEEEISKYSQETTTARAALAEDQARLNTARAQLRRGSGEDVGDALGSQVIQQLRAQRSVVSSRVADFEGRYGAMHPDLMKARRELADIDQQIRAEIGRIINSLEARVQISSQRTSTLSGSLSSAKASLATNNRASVRLRELERNAEAVKTLYQSFLNRYQETSTVSGIEKSDASIASAAQAPLSPSEPNILINLIAGFLVAAGMGGMAVVLAETFNSTLATAEEVERAVGLRSLGFVPTLGSVAKTSRSPADYVVERPLSAFAECFRNLVVSAKANNKGAKIIAVTSALPGEGKTITSVCLGKVLAMQGHRTLIIDCDLRRRSINTLLNVRQDMGLAEVLEGKVQLNEVLRRDEQSGVFYLLLSSRGPTPEDIFGSELIDGLLADLRQRFDYVVLDTAPVLPVADTRILGPKADAVIMLTRWRKTPRKALEQAIRLLQATGTPVAGVALTQVDLRRQAQSGYGDPAYYYKQYSSYYAG